LPDAIQTTMVSPKARMMPSKTAEQIPLKEAGITTLTKVSARVAPSA